MHLNNSLPLSKNVVEYFPCPFPFAAIGDWIIWTESANSAKNAACLNLLT